MQCPNLTKAHACGIISAYRNHVFFSAHTYSHDIAHRLYLHLPLCNSKDTYRTYGVWSPEHWKPCSLAVIQANLGDNSDYLRQAQGLALIHPKLPEMKRILHQHLAFDLLSLSQREKQLSSCIALDLFTGQELEILLPIWHSASIQEATFLQ